MSLEIRALPIDPASLSGLSERLIISHHENNYSGAVKRLNAIRGKLAELDYSNETGFLINGLKREELVAYNSMVLHELYFAVLGGDGQLPPGNLRDAIERDFGSLARWQTEFSAMGKALAGGSGWVLLVWSSRDGRLSNQWGADHCHVMAGGTPILALDMYEHAYHIDYGAKAAAYVDAFMKNILWDEVANRYIQCARTA
ncbi:superoxide dismutase [Pseudomonas stutzeri]|jgi:Fe-Mn family superoxide dismutase|uniref:superoxide dismutase n=1 Tax=Stutzerimonas stutzeri TaxID=316 RepID=A0AA42PCX4_STUST|nr:MULTISPECIES: superoxide dismutase [Stutzerimonas]HCF1813086.1 superoxide dismutase [Pseudomonas aeruginosa]MCF0017146.1 superoxide dismutase [Stutzerimonas stutzeri]MCF0021811.1 superoxide dismutase [Stutzerimonas stutzeri]MDH0103222.1 superoxide dismutase [Stutzerimonas stutzeri]MDH1237955.1 superoxide dismutase [Stutzerimonas stutzeri]